MQNLKQISAFISVSTNDRLERYAKAHGLKKGAVIDAALLHHLKALDELPQDLIIPPVIRLEPDAFERVATLVANPPAPTEELRSLMAGQPGEDVDD